MKLIKFEMKRIAALLLAVMMCALSFAACGEKNELPSAVTPGDDGGTVTVPKTEPYTEPVTEPETEPEEEIEPEPEPNPGPSTLWGNNLDAPGKVKTTVHEEGDFIKGARFYTWGSKLFYVDRSGRLRCQDVNDVQSRGTPVYGGKGAGG